MNNNELIQQARKCAVCMIGANECHRESCKIDNCADVINLLADALEAAQKEIERLKTQCDINATSFFDMRVQFKKAAVERDTYKAALQNWHEPQEGE